MATDSSAVCAVEDRRRAWFASILLRRQNSWLGRFVLQLQRLAGLGRGQRRRLERKAAVTLGAAALLMALGAGAMRPVTVHAATITVNNGTSAVSADGQCSLPEAIFNANDDYQVFIAPGECIAGSGADIIELATNVSLTSAIGSYSGETGLPLLDSEIIIDGNGFTIARQGGSPSFRIMAVASTGEITLQDVSVSGGVAAYGTDGGAIYNYLGDLTLQSATISGNEATGNGGGIFSVGGSVHVYSSSISGNKGVYGGGLAASDSYDVRLNLTSVSSNTATGDGGGIWADSGALFLTSSAVSLNTAADDGGGIFEVSGTVSITDSQIDGNTSTGGSGGGLYQQDAIGSVTGTTISNNKGRSGGGAHISGYGGADFVNTTISGNSSTIEGGGGLSNDNATVTLTSVTVTDNTAATDGGGVAQLVGVYGNITFVQSLISGNYAEDGDSHEIAISGGTASAAANNVFGRSEYNSAQAFENFTPGANDWNASSDGVIPRALANILDSTLADNGGPPLPGGGATMTHALVPGSPAIDHGTEGICFNAPVNFVDQRGLPRGIDIPVDGNDAAILCDSGAYEMQLPVDSYCPVDPNVGNELTDLLGTGQGSPTKGFRTRKLVVPNSNDVVSLYGQLAAMETGLMKYVRFLPQGEPKVQIHAPTSPAYRTYAVDWWGTDLPTDVQWVKGQFFWGTKGNKSPRAFVLWPTYNTTDEYANVFVTFDDSSENHVAWESGFIQTQTQVIGIPETQAAGADITVKLALVDVNKDGRSVTVTVEAGGVTVGPQVIIVPNQKDTLNLETFLLEGVAAGTSEVTITLESPNGTGDSAAMIGAAVSYPCDIPVR